MDKSLYNNPDLYITFQEYNPDNPEEPGPITKGKVFGIGKEFEIITVTDTESIPTVVTTHSGGGTSTTAAHTKTLVKNIAKEFTIVYCYSDDGVIKKVLPQHITVLNYKSI